MGNTHARLLLEKPIKSLVHDYEKTVINPGIASDATISTALLQLKESGLGHLPIKDSEWGTLSLTDIIYFLVKCNFQKDLFFNAKAADAVRAHTTIVVHPDSTVESVILRMLKYRPYRVCLSGGGEQGLETVHVVTQGDIIKWIFEHRKVLIDDHSQKTLLELPTLGSKGRVISVKENESVQAVCIKLCERRVHAVAVEDPKTGVMKAAVVPDSFQSLQPQHWIDFAMPIGLFEVPGREPTWVNSDATLEEVLEKLVKQDAHRVFVVTEAGHPGKVISTHDIMRFFIQSTEAGKVARKDHKRRNKPEELKKK